MNCNTYREKLHSYAAHSLSQLESHAVAKHLEVCPQCREAVKQIQNTKEWLNADKVPLLPPDTFALDIMNAINLNKYKATPKKDFSQISNWGMSLVASGIILLLLNTAFVGNNTILNTKKIEKITGTITQSIPNTTSLSTKLLELNGITGRMEEQIKGGK